MLNIPPQYKSLKFIQPIQWADIFDTWREGEADQESWKKHWEERGFDSWDEWRTAYAQPLQPENLEWFLYSVENSIEDMPLVYGVPTRGWINNIYGGKQTMRLEELREFLKGEKNEKVAAVKNNFPAETMLTGIVHEDKIILIEGMHRACALASWDKNIPLNSRIKIALAFWNKEVPVLGGNYKTK